VTATWALLLARPRPGTPVTECQASPSSLVPGTMAGSISKLSQTMWMHTFGIVCLGITNDAKGLAMPFLQ